MMQMCRVDKKGKSWHIKDKLTLADGLTEEQTPNKHKSVNNNTKIKTGKQSDHNTRVSLNVYFVLICKLKL
jgi:hypothetical protein